MTATFGLYAVDARNGGVQTSNSASANATALQTMIDNLSDTGGAIFVREPYPCNPLTLRKNVSLLGGDGPRFQGTYPYGGGAAASNSLPAGGGFIVTNTASPFISLEGSNAVRDLTFYYSSQNYGATTVAATTTYKPTIANGQAVTWNVSLSGLCFVGATHCIDLNYVTATETANVEVDLCYGYPLGGYFLRAATVLDIIRVSRCHVNPGAGSRFLPCSNVNVPFPYALIDDNVTNGVSAFNIDTCDEMMMSFCFVFGAKTAFTIANTYGSLASSQADMVTTGLNASPNASHKALIVTGFNSIPSAGPTPSARNAVVFGGTGGYLKMFGVHGFLGTNAAVSSSGTPSANALVKVNGSGAQRLDMVSGTKAAISGSWTSHVDQTNGSSTINQTHSP